MTECLTLLASVLVGTAISIGFIVLITEPAIKLIERIFFND